MGGQSIICAIVTMFARASAGKVECDCYMVPYVNSAPNNADWIAVWVQVVAALEGLTGSTVLATELWREQPPVGLFEGLQWREEAAATIVAAGGQESLWFLESEPANSVKRP